MKNVSSSDSESRDQGETSRKAYRTPKLTVYGDLRHLALAKGGKKSDGIRKTTKS